MSGACFAMTTGCVAGQTFYIASPAIIVVHSQVLSEPSVVAELITVWTSSGRVASVKFIKYKKISRYNFYVFPSK